MNSQFAARKAVLTLAGAAMATAGLIPVAAHAQQYGAPAYDQRGQYYYDPCARDQTGRSVVGAIVGGLAGMALGNNIGNDQHRHGRYVHDDDTGAAVGALVGAGVGASVGRSSAACGPVRRQANVYTPDYGYQYDYGRPVPNGRGYGQGYGNGRAYDPRYAQPQYAPPAYDYQYQEQYQEQPYDEGYDTRGVRGCTMVENRIRMPDGRVQTRMVQACPDSQGRYQIVD